MMIGETWTVVPCPGSRSGELFRLVDELDLDTERLIVVTTDLDTFTEDVCTRLILPWAGHRWISQWWNAGLEYVAAQYADDPGAPYQVFLPGSDVRGKPDSVHILAHYLRVADLSMVGPDLHNVTPGRSDGLRFTRGSRRTIFERVPGACFMVAGEHALRCDESFRWWYSDDDLEMQARCRNGTAVVADTGLRHDTDHALDPEQERQAAEDRARYVHKWGRDPW
jgi:hypothetical protein